MLREEPNSMPPQHPEWPSLSSEPSTPLQWLYGLLHLLLWLCVSLLHNHENRFLFPHFISYQVAFSWVLHARL